FLSGQAPVPPAPPVPPPLTPVPPAPLVPPALRPADTEPALLHMDDVDVRKAFEILSREGSFNILVSPNVTGRVTANLKGLNPEQALDAILKLSNLVAQREKGII